VIINSITLTDKVPYDEAELLANFAEGDASAFNTLYERYYEPIRLNIFKIVRNETITDDLLQEVFILFWKKRAQFAGKKTVSGWLFVISYNRSINFLRRQATEKLYLKSISFTRLIAENPEDEQIQELQFQLLEDAISHLSPQRRRVFELCRLQGKSYHETADQLSISKNTVKEHLVKAGDSIRNYVDNHSEDLKVLSVLLMVLSIDKNSF
jgi:RNA polymerase sigma-70 factor (family 1)